MSLWALWLMAAPVLGAMHPTRRAVWVKPIVPLGQLPSAKKALEKTFSPLAARTSCPLRSAKGTLPKIVLPSRQFQAFGDKTNTIQFGLELEGSSNEILRFYMPQGWSQAEWTQLGLPERAQIKDQLLAKHPSTGWAQFMRMKGAPAYLADRLLKDGRSWELRTAPTARLDVLMSWGRFLQQRVDAKGRFHWHVTFRSQPEQAQAIASFLAQGNEYAALKWFAEHPRNVSKDRHLGPSEDVQFADVERAVATNRSAEWRKLHKYSSMSLRAFRVEDTTSMEGQWLYGEPGRIGFEIRSLHYDLEEAARTILSAAQVLERPANARIRLGERSLGYRLADLHGVQRFGISAFLAFPERVRAWLLDVGKKAGRAEKNIRHWSIPLVKWQSRVYMPVTVGEQVTEAKNWYLRQVKQLSDASPHGSPEEIADKLDRLITEWSRHTRLWQYF